MRDKEMQGHGLYPPWPWLLLIALLAAGLFFRFTNLGKKVYWNDETRTSLRISGYSRPEMMERVFDGHEIGAQDLQKFQHLNAERGLISTVKSLAEDDPKHPPLYYALVRVWARLWGDSVGVIRSLSAFISLLAFPCLYWLCRELFEERRTAWMAIALMAVSPIHVLYAQEAREYSLWTVMILLSSAALLRAMRRQTGRSWALYALSVGLGLYTHTLFGLVILSHGAYAAGSNLKVISFKEFRFPKVLIDYLLATLIGVAAFAPWAFIIIKRLPRLLAHTEWATQKVSLLYSTQWWFHGLSSVFIDISSFVPAAVRQNVAHLSSSWILLPVLLILLLVLTLAGYAIYFLCYTTPKRVWLFVLMMAGGAAVALVLPDLIFGGRISLVPRYWIPSYLGLQLAVAHLLATQIISVNTLRRMIWQTVTMLLISGGAASCAISSQAEVWWNKEVRYDIPEVARLINQAQRPLLMSDASVGQILPLSYFLEPKVRLRFAGDVSALRVPDGFSDIFLINPSESLRQRFEKEGYTMESIHTRGKLWRLAKQPSPGFMNSTGNHSCNDPYPVSCSEATSYSASDLRWPMSS